MINWEGKDQNLLALIKYIANEDKLEKVLENPQVIKTPVVRNGKQSTLGYQPDVWKSGIDYLDDESVAWMDENYDATPQTIMLESIRDDIFVRLIRRESGH